MPDLPVLPTTLLTSKLERPRLGPQLVPRQTLLVRLDESLTVPLMLLSAPAGFGKTTVAAEWLAARTPPTPASAPADSLHAAWLTLDASDNDPLRFWTYVTAACAARFPCAAPPCDAEGVAGALDRLLAQLRHPPAPPLEQVVETLLAALHEAPPHFVLVFDGYELIAAQRIHDTLNYFITHLPGHVHLILCTRADPPLPLNRWRMRGTLLELRAADLCFTVEEAGAMLSRRTKLVLPPEALEILIAHTDGWPAGLQLLAASLQGRAQQDISRYVENFAGSSRFVLDYLMEEVLQNQPQPVRDFLLRTSILQRFTAELCDVLMDEPGAPEAGAAGVDHDAPLHDGGDAPLSSRAILNYLESYSLFLVPLDDERRWFRYYHLFAEALHAELDRSAPSLGGRLHRRAARWYAAHAMLEEAIDHALLGSDWEQAADLLDVHGHALLVRGEFASLYRWSDALPAGAAAGRPRLALLHGWLKIFRGPLQEVQVVIEQVLAHLEEGAFASSDQRMRGEVAALRALTASYRWEVRAALALCTEAEHLLPPEDIFSRAAVSQATGHAYMLAGRSAEAIAAYTGGQALAQTLGSVYMQLFPTFRIAQTHLRQGALTAAQATYRSGLQQALDHGGAQWPILADAYLGLADLLCERNDLLAAEHYVRRALLLAPLRSVEIWAAAVALQARIRMALGRPESGAASGAASLADALATARHYNNVHLTEWLAAHQARMDLAAGHIEAARQWAQSQSGVWNEAGYYPEFEELTLARFYLADRRPRAALALLALWRGRAERRARTRGLIEIDMLTALADWTLNQRTEAQTALARALALAEPEAIVRIFLDEGERIAPLLDALAPINEAAARVRAALQSGPDPSGATLTEPLERLTPRELEILRAIARGASNQQIADTFVLTVGTVKGHVNHILSKLGARNRTEAVANAREIGLL